MAHRPGGQGIAEAIKRNAVPAILHKKINPEGVKDNWRNFHDIDAEDIEVYLILKEEEMENEDEGEAASQEAVFYTTNIKLKTGQAVEFPDQGEAGWLFLIKKSVQKPAVDPVYFKARGVMQD